MSNDMQSSTFLETILLKDLVKGALNCLSPKRFCHMHKTEAAKFPFPVSANLVLFVNTRKAGNVYVQWVIEKVVLFVLSGKHQQYPSGLGYYFRERRLSQPFPKYTLLMDVTRKKERKGFMENEFEKSQIFLKRQTSIFTIGFLRVFNMVICIMNLQQGDLTCRGAHGVPSHGQFHGGAFSRTSLAELWKCDCGHCWSCLPELRTGNMFLTY